MTDAAAGERSCSSSNAWPRRLPTLFAVSLLVFFFVDLIPGDPAQILAGPTATDEEVRSIREFLGLNQPLLNRYGHFLQGLWDPTVATSFRTQRPVVVELAERLPNTLTIAIGGLVLGLLAGTVAGIDLRAPPGRYGRGRHHGSDAGGHFDADLLAGPALHLAVRGHISAGLPAAGASTPAHFVLPILVLATRPTAMFSRLVAASLLEAMGKDYLDTARAKGLSETSVVLFHALRNSLIAAVSVAGVQFGGMLGGSVVTETVFGIPGVGRLLVDAVSRADYPVIQYVILMFAVFLRRDQSRHRYPDAMARPSNPRRRASRMTVAANPLAAGPALDQPLDFVPKSRWTVLRRIVSQPKGAIGLTLVVLYLLLAVFGPVLAPDDAFRQNFGATLQRPSAAHWFGTDQLGRDVLSRVLVGARATLGIGVGGVALAFLIGVPLGVLAAWRRGWIDAAIMRVVDVMLSFPDIVFALAHRRNSRRQYAERHRRGRHRGSSRSSPAPRGP